MNEPTPGRRKLPNNPIPREEPAGDGQALKVEDGKHKLFTPEAGRRTIKVTWGEENFHPVAYNGFKVGGIELVVDVPPNQTIEECYEQTYARLDAIVAKQFERKLEGFIERLRTAGQAVKVSAASKGQ